ncbi:MAG: BlaI/MecI/CopY family transcriptional regulator [Planctomycetota bacterium]
MSRRDLEPLTAAEWKVMRVVWERGDGAARDVYEVCGAQHGMAVSTVKTHLRRLVDKGYLTTTLVGNSFLYRATRPPLRSLLAAADRLLENAIEGTAGPLLAYMLKKSRISDDELAELRALLEAHGGDGRKEGA